MLTTGHILVSDLAHAIISAIAMILIKLIAFAKYISMITIRSESPWKLSRFVLNDNKNQTKYGKKYLPWTPCIADSLAAVQFNSIVIITRKKPTAEIRIPVTLNLIEGLKESPELTNVLKNKINTRNTMRV